MPYDLCFATLLTVIDKLPRWRTLSQNRETGEILAMRSSRLFRFIDDIQIQILKKNEHELTVDLSSTSRVGKGDFGQNARNIRTFFVALDEQLPLPTSTNCSHPPDFVRL